MTTFLGNRSLKSGRTTLSTTRAAILLSSTGLAILGLLVIGPLFKRWRINHAVTELQTYEAQQLGEVPRAFTRLESIGLDDVAVVSALLDALGDDEVRKRYWGAGPDSGTSRVPRLFDLLVGVGQPAVPPLIELLQNDDRRVREIAADTLKRMGTDAEPAIPALMAAANDPEVRENRYNTVNKPLDALVKLGRYAVPALVESLKSREEDVRVQAVEALFLMRSEAEGAAPDLVELLITAPDADDALGDGLSVTPADALVRIGSAAIAPLKDALSHPDEAARRRVEKVLRRIEHPEQPMATTSGAQEDDQIDSVEAVR